jgi:hypothetical protein
MDCKDLIISHLQTWRDWQSTSKTQEMAAFSKFLRFLKWKTDGKWKTDLITALGASKRPLGSLQLGTSSR